MEKWANGWIDRPMDRWMNEQRERGRDGHVDRWKELNSQDLWA